MRLYITIILAAFINFSVLPANANQSSELEFECQKKVKLQGPANLSKSIAETKAIISWIRNVTSKFDEDHAIWHRAKNKSTSCKKGKGSQYYYCMISAEPCKLKPAETATN